MVPLQSRLSANIFLHVPPPQSSTLTSSSSSSSSKEKKRGKKEKSRRTLIFFIPGNPGLIGYYHPFLALVVRGLRGIELEGESVSVDVDGNEGRDRNGGEGDERGERGAARVVVVAGLSLGGFDVDEASCRSEEMEKEGDGRQGKKEAGGGGGDDHDNHDADADERKDHESRGGDGNMVSTLSRGPRGSVPEDREMLYPPSFPFRSRHGQQQEHHDARADRKENGTAEEQRKIYTLREQIELSYARVEYLTQRLQEQSDLSEGASEPVPVEIVLVGHSVGAYIALELVRLWHQRHQHQHYQQQQPPPPPPPLVPPRTTDPTKTSNAPLSSPSWSISTCILLTPTIQDIHLSPSGRLATPPLSYLPFLPGLAHTLLHTLLLRILPLTWLSLLVSGATGMEPNSHGLETTMAFLKSKRGVKEALFMARGEMKEIRRDTWGEEVWGASHSGALTAEDDRGKSMESPKLFFWFAKKDHWVADVTKEAICKRRAADVGVQRDCLTEPRPYSETEEVEFMEQDPESKTTTGPARIQILETEALVHAWCLNQSEFVARRVSSWLREARGGRQ